MNFLSNDQAAIRFVLSSNGTVAVNAVTRSLPKEDKLVIIDTKRTDFLLPSLQERLLCPIAKDKADILLCLGHAWPKEGVSWIIQDPVDFDCEEKEACLAALSKEHPPVIFLSKRISECDPALLKQCHEVDCFSLGRVTEAQCLFRLFDPLQLAAGDFIRLQRNP